MRTEEILPADADSALLKAMDTSMGVVEFSPDGTILRANENFLNFTGYSAKELLGRNHKELCTVDTIISPDYVKFWRSLAQGAHKSGLFMRKASNGSSIWLEGAYAPVTRHGRAEKIILFCVNVTGRQELAGQEAARLDILDRFMVFAEYSPEGIILNANINLLAALGYNADDIIGRNRESLFTEAELKAGLCSEPWGHIQSGNSYAGLFQRTASGGEPIWFEGFFTPLCDAAGKLFKVFFYAIDVSSRMREYLQEREKARQLSALVDHTDNAIVMTNNQCKITYVNPGFYRMFGYRPEEMLGKTASTVLGARNRQVTGGIKENGKKSRPYVSEELAAAKSGQRFWCSLTSNPIIDSEGNHRLSVTVFTDINRTKLQSILQIRALEAMARGVSTKEVLELVCREVESMLPETVISVSGLDHDKKPYLMAAPSLPPAADKALSEVSCGHGACVWEEKNGLKQTGEQSTGQIAPLSLQTPKNRDMLADPYWPSESEAFRSMELRSGWSVPIMSSTDKLLGAVTFYFRHQNEPEQFQHQLLQIVANICALTLEREKIRDTMRYLTFYDPVTGLPNRELFLADGSRLLRAQASDRHAVLVIQLSRFKRLVETIGKSASDSMLCKVLSMGLKHKSAESRIGRISDDAVAVFCPSCTAEQAAEKSKFIQRVFSRPVMEDGVEARMSVSVGISLYPDNGRDIETLLDNATLAVTRAAGQTQGNRSFFSVEMDYKCKEELAMEAELCKAIENNSLYLVYQPQVFLQGRGLCGVEALSRWDHTLFGQISPARFIPLAEECGLIDKLGRWSLDEACRQLQIWRTQGLNIPSISVNLSAICFHDRNLPEQARQTVAKYALQPSDIIMELTESVLLDNNRDTMGTIFSALHSGFRFSMDDFGTGYSCLSSLRTLPFTELKLDRSFVKDLERDETCRQLSLAVSHIAGSLNLTTIAEGIETPEQQKLLAGQGYDAAQGFLQSKPLPPDEFAVWLTGFNRL